MVGARMLLQERLDRNVIRSPSLPIFSSFHFLQNFQHITSTTMSMSDLHTEMEMESPPHSPPATSTVNMQEMDMEQDDDDMNVQPAMPAPPLPPPRGAPHAPMMISRLPPGQTPIPSLPSGFPPALPTDKLPAPLKPQDVIIKSYNPKGKFPHSPQSSSPICLFQRK